MSQEKEANHLALLVESGLWASKLESFPSKAQYIVGWLDGLEGPLNLR